MLFCCQVLESMIENNGVVGYFVLISSGKLENPDPIEHRPEVLIRFGRISRALAIDPPLFHWRSVPIIIKTYHLPDADFFRRASPQWHTKSVHNVIVLLDRYI